MFLLSIRAGGVGLNLQAADTVIMYDTGEGAVLLADLDCTVLARVLLCWPLLALRVSPRHVIPSCPALPVGFHW